MNLRRFASSLLVISLVAAGLLGPPGPASAYPAASTTSGVTPAAVSSVVVPPGGAGHTCSSYHFITPQHYWQTCAWADYKYVWFTVEFGNTFNYPWYPDAIYLDFYSSGTFTTCKNAIWVRGDIVIPPNRTRGTERNYCYILPRERGAYASTAFVEDKSVSDAFAQNSPTLQVQ
jgi:hypothetical protein